MASINAWDKVHFWIYLLNQNSLSHQTWSIIDITKGNNFQESFEIWRTGARFQVLFNLATFSNYSVTNHFKIPVFHFFEKVNKGQLKMESVQYDWTICLTYTSDSYTFIGKHENELDEKDLICVTLQNMSIMCIKEQH